KQNGRLLHKKPRPLGSLPLTGAKARPGAPRTCCGPASPAAPSWDLGLRVLTGSYRFVHGDPETSGGGGTEGGRGRGRPGEGEGEARGRGRPREGGGGWGGPGEGEGAAGRRCRLRAAPGGPADAPAQPPPAAPRSPAAARPRGAPRPREAKVKVLREARPGERAGSRPERPPRGSRRLRAPPLAPTDAACARGGCALGWGCGGGAGRGAPCGAARLPGRPRGRRVGAGAAAGSPGGPRRPRAQAPPCPPLPSPPVPAPAPPEPGKARVASRPRRGPGLRPLGPRAPGQLRGRLRGLRPRLPPAPPATGSSVRSPRPAAQTPWGRRVTLLGAAEVIMAHKRHREKRVLDPWSNEEVTKNELRKIKEDIPETKVKFTSLENPETDSQFLNISCSFQVSSPIFYELQKGQALITFEREEVAQNVIRMGKHRIHIEDVDVEVVAKPVPLNSGVRFQVHEEVSKVKINVSEIPDALPEDQMRDKLELSFSKSRNGGGEVLCVQYHRPSHSAVVTFMEAGVADKILKKKDYPLYINENCYNVIVSPYTETHLKQFQMFSGISERTVLLTGMEDLQMMDEEILQDLVNIHFQREKNGGGEVEVVKCALDQPCIAYFEE
uniref:N-myc and STAT interactor n=1 Tax=Canis lupus familiaris TaxID=9615 RepID=A0A8C0Z4P4_CANLF